MDKTHKKIYIIYTPLITLIVMVAFLPLVFGENKNLTCDTDRHPSKCFNILIKQNEILQKKIDWNNCATAHKLSNGYVYTQNIMEYKQNAYTFNMLTDICGKIP